MFIQRNYQRTEHDDYVLNVQKFTDKLHWAVPQYDANSRLVGWKIQSARE